MKYFNARKHFGNSQIMYDKLCHKANVYIQIGIITKKLNLKRLNNWACERAEKLLYAEMKLLTANMELLNMLFKNGYVK